MRVKGLIVELLGVDRSAQKQDRIYNIYSTILRNSKLVQNAGPLSNAGGYWTYNDVLNSIVPGTR